MIPFRVYNREERSIWLVLNYHDKSDRYLIAKETEDEHDGEIAIIDSAKLSGLQLVDFLDDDDDEM